MNKKVFCICIIDQDVLSKEEQNSMPQSRQLTVLASTKQI